MSAQVDRLASDDLAALLNSAATGFALLDSSGRILFFNRALADWMGGDGQRSIDDLDIDERAKPEITAAARHSRPMHFETRIRTPSGYLHVLGSGRPVTLGTTGEAYLLEIVNISTISRRERDLRRLVLRDTLTGVASRRHFLDLGEQAFADRKRSGSALSVGMLDIDHFKHVNDLYGHTMGDMVLSVVAACCTEELRRHDVIGRLGGDEFGLIMPSTPLDIAVGVADRLRAQVIEAIREEPVHKVNVTVSIGLTQANTNDDSFEQLLNRADQALYTAKRSGRNRTAAIGE
ncbi:MAG: sensor domain-containing diguanylate cyclase [Geminicoccaceae bacterium]|nr:sensor domain-containing diguanylate cyclase [Geminicoccaceae bacterium]